jgi:CubicO group peptidase (beta-lactamase class C family)
VTGKPDPAVVADMARRFMREFEIPGLALAIVTPGATPVVQGHGLRMLGEPHPVDGDTVFAIASNTKAFLCACLALLVDEGRLGWDDAVVRHLPEFRMADPAVTAMMTVRDLLVHRSGLPQGAGDLMQFPRTDHTMAEVLQALPHFRPSGFRNGYAYDNCLYLVAGVLLERVSGLGWDDFVETRIFAPLGMAEAVGSSARVRSTNLSARHMRLGPPALGMGRLEVVPANESPLIGPAGGINVSARGIVPWLRAQLARGAMAGGGRLWSERRAEEMWMPHTIVSSGPGPTSDQPQRSVMQGYALGWAVSDYRGRRMLTHGGGLAGQSSRTTLLPEEGIAFTLMSNSGDTEPVSGLRYELLDYLLGVSGLDWLARTRASVDAGERQVRALLQDVDFKAPEGGPTLPLDRYAGRYRDPWYGDLLVSRKGSGLTVNFTRTPPFKSVLEPFGPDAFRTRFPRGAGEDAVLNFLVEADTVTRISLRALSPIADLSFDFHDLAFSRVRDDAAAR